MNRLPNIELNRNEVNYLIKNKGISCGSEGLIVVYDRHTAIKIFGDWLDTKKMTYMSDNKFSKIKKLYQYKLDYMVKIKASVSLEGKLIGYMMSYSKRDVSISKLDIPFGIMNDILINIRKIIEYYHKYNIIYGDIFPGNILIDYRKYKISFCDVDNIKIDNYKIDFLGKVLTNYVNTVGCIDNKLDAYAYNILSILLTFHGNNPSINRSYVLNAIRNYGDIVCDDFCRRHFIQDKTRVRRITNELLDPISFSGDYLL